MRSGSKMISTAQQLLDAPEAASCEYRGLGVVAHRGPLLRSRVVVLVQPKVNEQASTPCSRKAVSTEDTVAVLVGSSRRRKEIGSCDPGASVARAWIRKEMLPPA